MQTEKQTNKKKKKQKKEQYSNSLPMSVNYSHCLCYTHIQNALFYMGFLHQIV